MKATSAGQQTQQSTAAAEAEQANRQLVDKLASTEKERDEMKAKITQNETEMTSLREQVQKIQTVSSYQQESGFVLDLAPVTLSLLQHLFTHPHPHPRAICLGQGLPLVDLQNESITVSNCYFRRRNFIGNRELACHKSQVLIYSIQWKNWVPHMNCKQIKKHYLHVYLWMYIVIYISCPQYMRL